IESWPVAALKSYIGHSLASSAGDQLCASLGVWRYGILPGILSTEAVADDVHREHLDFLLQHREVGPEGMDAVLINSKGFGGNNASASILAPHIALRMLEKRHGSAAMKAYRGKNEGVQEHQQRYDDSVIERRAETIYRFDYQV